MCGGILAILSLLIPIMSACDVGCTCADNWRCTGCGKGYIPTSYPFTYKCYQCSGTGCMKECVAGYPDGTCAYCQTGYYLNATKYCIQNPVGCSVIKEANMTNTSIPYGYCLACSTNYSYNATGLACVTAPIPNCANVSTNGTCILCLKYFALQNNTCVPDSPNCSTFGPEGFCTSCDATYLPNATVNDTQCIQCVHKVCPANCITVNSSGLCNACSAGNYLTNTSTCAALPANCVSAAGNGSCVTCMEWYSPTDGVCVPYIANCLNFSHTGMCMTCVKGYLPNSVRRATHCVKCNATVCPANCSAVNSTGLCRTCSLGFYLNVNETCTKMPTGCGNITATGKCLACAPLYIPNNITNITQCSKISITNCIEGVGTNCTACEPGFNLTNNTCMPSVANCSSFSTTGQCIGCYPNYLPANGYPTTSCDSCGGPCPVNCTGFVNGTCTVCVSGTYLYKNQCSNLPEGCIAGDVNGCTACMRHYLPNELPTNASQYVTCYQNSVRHCATANSTGCTSCVPNFVVAPNGTCVDQVPNCAVYADGVCYACNGGYMPSSPTQCTQCPGGVCQPHCQDVHANGTCYFCQGGYVMVNGSCIVFVEPVLTGRRISYGGIAGITVVMSCLFVALIVVAAILGVKACPSRTKRMKPAELYNPMINSRSTSV